MSALPLTPEHLSLNRLAEPLVEGIDRLHETFAAQFGNIDSGELDIGAGEGQAIVDYYNTPVKTVAGASGESNNTPDTANNTANAMGHTARTKFSRASILRTM